MSRTAHSVLLHLLVLLVHSLFKKLFNCRPCDTLHTPKSMLAALNLLDTVQRYTSNCGKVCLREAVFGSHGSNIPVRVCFCWV